MSSADVCFFFLFFSFLSFKKNFFFLRMRHRNNLQCGDWFGGWDADVVMERFVVWGIFHSARVNTVCMGLKSPVLAVARRGAKPPHRTISIFFCLNKHGVTKRKHRFTCVPPCPPHHPSRPPPVSASACRQRCGPRKSRWGEDTKSVNFLGNRTYLFYWIHKKINKQTDKAAASWVKGEVRIEFGLCYHDDLETLPVSHGAALVAVRQRVFVI